MLKKYDSDLWMHLKTLEIAPPAIRDVSIQNPIDIPPPPSPRDVSIKPEGNPLHLPAIRNVVFKPEGHMHPLHLQAIRNVNIQTRRASPSPPSYTECEYLNLKEIPPPLHFPAELYRM